MASSEISEYINKPKEETKVRILHDSGFKFVKENPLLSSEPFKTFIKGSVGISITDKEAFTIHLGDDPSIGCVWMKVDNNTFRNILKSF